MRREDMADMKQLDINYKVADRDLKYYIFDWDNNILHMPTYIHLEELQPDGSRKPVAVTTEQYSRIRNDTEKYGPPEDDWEKAFREFRDIEIEDENVFIHHTRIAIDRVVNGEEPSGPSFRIFRRVLAEGRMFAIVTARGHKPEVIRRGVEYFIDAVLDHTERADMLRNLRGYLECYEPGHGIDLNDDDAVIRYYLSLNRYHAVTCPEFRKRMGLIDKGPQAETGKQLAIRDFVSHAVRIARERKIKKPISFGFSDDDPGNVQAIDEFIRSALAKEFPGIKFVLYDTSDPTLEAGKKQVVSGQLTLEFQK